MAKDWGVKKKEDRMPWCRATQSGAVGFCRLHVRGRKGKASAARSLSVLYRSRTEEAGSQRGATSNQVDGF